MCVADILLLFNTLSVAGLRPFGDSGGEEGQEFLNARTLEEAECGKLRFGNQSLCRRTLLHDTDRKDPHAKKLGWLTRCVSRASASTMILYVMGVR